MKRGRYTVVAHHPQGEQGDAGKKQRKESHKDKKISGQDCIGRFKQWLDTNDVQIDAGVKIDGCAGPTLLPCQYCCPEVALSTHSPSCIAAALLPS